MRIVMVLCALTLSACTDPTLSAGVAVGAGNVSISPALSGRVGGASVYVSN